jgi:hypothetical protein
VVRAEPGASTPRLTIEWIEEDGARLFVRESRGVQVLGDPWTLEEPEFLGGTGPRTSATVFGADPAGRRGHWTITLGPPGQFSVSPLR